MKNDLLKTALLGTDRSDLSPESKVQLAGWRLDPTEESARLLLEGSAITNNLQRAAGVFPFFPGDLPTFEAVDEHPPVSARSARHLHQILHGSYRPALREYLAHLNEQQKRLPAESLPPLFTTCLQNRELWEVLRRVIGRRGHWLLTLNPAWRSLYNDPKTGNWKTGEREERLAILRHLRRHAPERGIELLRTTWPEESAEDRATFLEELNTGLSGKDEAFLEECLQDRRKEVRRRAADLLSRLPASALIDRHWQRLGRFLTLSSEGNLELTLPVDLDKESKRDGIELRSPGHYGGGQKAGWIGQMIACVPPRRWEERFGLSPEKLLPLFRRSEWADTLLPAVYEATARHRDIRWAESAAWQLLQDADGEEWATPAARNLLENLPESVFNSVALRFMENHPEGPGEDHPLTHLLSLEFYDWEDRLGRLLIRSLQHNLQKSTAFFRQPVHYLRILRVAGFRVSPGLLETLKSGWPYQSPGWPHWEKPVEHFLTTLFFRRKMIEELEKPS